AAPRGGEHRAATQPAALRLAPRDHEGEEEAGGGAHPGRPRRGHRAQGQGAQALVPAGAQGGHHRSGRRHPGGEAPQRGEGHLKEGGHPMSNVLVVAEHLNQSLKKSSLHALEAARQIAARTGGKVYGLVVGSGVGEIAKDLARHGADEVLVADDARVEHALAETWSKVIEKAAREVSATYVVAPAGSQAKDVLPRVAVRLEAGMASDVIGFGGEGAELTFRRPMWAGSVIAE